VADDFGGKGLGSRLMEGIMDAAHEKGLADVEGLVLSNNADMLKLMRASGSLVKPSGGPRLPAREQSLQG
jgi:acetyltransferase